MAGGMKLAVVLFNLGGPSKKADIFPFLFNFFRDKNVVTLPQPFRTLLAAWIAFTRSKGAGRTAYSHLGGKSPLLEHTVQQAIALEKELQIKNPDTRVFVSMRHWHPMAAEVTKIVAEFQPDKIILLPLYPQYSTTTTLSSLQNWHEEAAKAGLKTPTESICCYPTDGGFVSASAALITEQLKKTPEKMRILFSAHGLPEKIIQAGDPYQRQCELTAAAIVKQLGAADWQLCYQSRIGRLKWIGPSIDEALQKAAADKTGVVVYPLSFVSEHVETLVELDIEYRHRAETLGIKTYLRAQTAGTHPAFIQGLSALVLSRVASVDCIGVDCVRTCPKNFNKCYCENKSG